MIPRRSTDIRGRHLANVCPANEQDVRPLDIRPNRNAARENATSDRSLHNNPADRTEIFFPDDVEEVMTLARLLRRSVWGRLLFLTLPRSPATRLFPASSHALSRWTDTALGFPLLPATRRRLARLAAIAAPSTGRLEIDSRIPSAGSDATRCDRRELVSSNVLKHPEEGPRELLSRKVKSRIEAANFNPRRLFQRRHHQPDTTNPPRYLSQTPSRQWPNSMAIHLRLSDPDSLDELAEISWPLTSSSQCQHFICQPLK